MASAVLAISPAMCRRMKEPSTGLTRVNGGIEQASSVLEHAANLKNHGHPAAHRIAGVASLSLAAITSHWKHAFRLVSREHVLSLADQAVVSATGFLTTLLIARWSDSFQLGIYALGLSVLVSVVGLQESLILQPYLIQRFYPEGTPAERAGASLALSILFSAASVLMLIVAAFGLLVWGAGQETVILAWVIAGIVPFALTRDFARRFAFAHLDTRRVLLLDFAAAIIQLGTLGWLGASGRMSATSACAALGAGCAFPTAIWLYHARVEFAVRLRQVQMAFKQTWALGKWLLIGRITVQVQGYITYWLAAALGGAAITGVYAACMSIIGFANPLMIGLTNVIMPKSVLAWKHEGGPGLLREAIRNTAVIAALMTAFSVAVFFGGEHVMRFLYHGKDFQGYGRDSHSVGLRDVFGVSWHGCIDRTGNHGAAAPDHYRHHARSSSHCSAGLGVDDEMGSAWRCLRNARGEHDRDGRTLDCILPVRSKDLRPRTCRARASGIHQVR